MPLSYTASKEIVPGRDRPMGFLNVLGERERAGASLVFKVFASTTEKPQVLNFGDIEFYPEVFEDARKAMEFYDSIISYEGFKDAVDGKKRESRRMRRA